MKSTLRRRTTALLAGAATAAAVALSGVLVPTAAALADTAPGAPAGPGTPATLATGTSLAHPTDILTTSAGATYAAIATGTGQHLDAAVVRRGPDGGWEAPHPLSHPSLSASGPVLAERPDGGVVAVWSQFTGSVGSVWFAQRPADGDWSEPEPITADGRQPQVGVAGDGSVIVVWQLSSTARVAGAVRAPDGTWSGPALVSGPAGGFDPAVSVNDAGQAVAVWSVYDRIRAARYTPGSGWGAPADVSTPKSQSAAEPGVVLDDTGAATTAWVQYYAVGESDYTGHAETARLEPDAGAWSPTSVLSAPTALVREVAVRVDADGDVTTLWPEVVDGRTTIRSARRTDAGWQPASTVGTSGVALTSPSELVLDVDPGGRAAAAWADVPGPGQVVLRVAATDATGAWGPGLPILDEGLSSLPRIDVTPDGDVDAAYSLTHQGVAVRAAFLDRTLPEVDPPSIPGSGQAGQPLAFAVAATDRWSGIGEVVWDFGDGATATGAEATHAYATGGTFPVAVTVADGSGNAVRRTGSVTVTAAPGPSGPVASAPRILTARLTAPRIRAVGSAAHAPRATRLRVRLSAPARLTVTISRVGSARPRAILTRTVGRTGEVVLRARLGKRLLRPGRYAVRVVASTPSGRSAVVTRALRVVWR